MVQIRQQSIMNKIKELEEQLTQARQEVKE